MTTRPVLPAPWLQSSPCALPPLEHGRQSRLRGPLCSGLPLLARSGDLSRVLDELQARMFPAFSDPVEDSSQTGQV